MISKSSSFWEFSINLLDKAMDQDLKSNKYKRNLMKPQSSKGSSQQARTAASSSSSNKVNDIINVF